MEILLALPMLLSFQKIDQVRLLLGAASLLHKFFRLAQIFPFLRGQIIGPQRVTRQPQMTDTKYLPRVFADLACFFLFALTACPFEEFLADLLDAFLLIPIVAETLTNNVEVS
jgi:hypothetical protein